MVKKIWLLVILCYGGSLHSMRKLATLVYTNKQLVASHKKFFSRTVFLLRRSQDSIVNIVNLCADLKGEEAAMMAKLLKPYIDTIIQKQDGPCRIEGEDVVVCDVYNTLSKKVFPLYPRMLIDIKYDKNARKGVSANIQWEEIIY